MKAREEGTDRHGEMRHAHDRGARKGFRGWGFRERMLGRGFRCGISGEGFWKAVFRRGISGRGAAGRRFPKRKAEDYPPPFAFQAAFLLPGFLELAALHEVEELLVGLR